MNQRKILSFLVAMMMLVTLAFTGCSKQQAIYTAGTYEGEGQGHQGPIVVEVTVNETEIEEIEIIEFNDSDFAVNPANQMTENIIEANSAEIDAVAGASVTSKGVLDAVKDALSKAYVDRSDSSSDTAVSKTADVVVIGSGGAGLTAAIEASANGAKVIVLEKMPVIGGNTKYATGGLNAAETISQEALGIEDSVESYIEDTMTGGYDINDLDLVTTLAENSAETVAWLIEIGADLTDVGRMAGASQDRAHRPTGGAPVGNHLVDVLYAKAQEMGIDVRLDSEVIEVVSEGGKASGVVVSAADGEYTIESKAVVIATGGFGANNELVASYDAALEGYGTTNHPGATGDVIEFAEAFDIAYIDMEQIQTHPTVMPSNNYMITEAVRGNGAILVNREAKRFVNELETRDVVSDAQLAQTGASGFLLFDQSVRESLSAIDGYYEKGFLIEGQTIEELAEALEIDSATLKATIDGYNSFVNSGTDSEFGRADMPRELSVGPYYAVEVAPAIHHTMGGIKINTNAEVFNNNGETIEGLFAAGEVTGGVHGGNRLGGNALADITTFGRIAGKNAAEFIK
jgi:fumarate reductase flavoprotein subunit